MTFYEIAMLVLNCVALWKLFEKSQEQNWKAIIPFYNRYTYCKLADCVPLFVAEVILSVIIYGIIFAAWIASILFAFNGMSSVAILLGDMEGQYVDKAIALMQLSIGGIVLAVLGVLIVLICLIVIRVIINLKFVKCYSDNVMFKILAGIGSIPVLSVFVIVVRCILAFDEQYRYHSPGNFYE